MGWRRTGRHGRGGGVGPQDGARAMGSGGSSGGRGRPSGSEHGGQHAQKRRDTCSRQQTQEMPCKLVSVCCTYLRTASQPSRLQYLLLDST